MTAQVTIAGRRVGPDHEPYVVAEMSGNHNGSLERALEIVRAAAAAGADALKIQTFTADSMTLDVDRPEFRVSPEHPLWGGRSLYSLYEQAATPYEWHAPIFDLAAELGIHAFSTPFDRGAVEFLESLGAPAYKIASLEVVDIPLIREVASTGKPVIISTGTATLAEVGAAVEAARGAGCTDLVVLACTSSYPAPAAQANLARIPAIEAATGCVVGLSDHTIGTAVSIAAIALGARIIEKHVTLRRADGGVDAEFSLEPAELADLKQGTTAAWQAVGSAVIAPVSAEAESLRSRRSIHVVADVSAGDLVTVDNVRAVRPAGGLAPVEIDRVIGRRFAVPATRGTPMSWDLVAPRGPGDDAR
jgi:pseudaminic acid synthase